jgi:hypothetical protein
MWLNCDGNTAIKFMQYFSSGKKNAMISGYNILHDGISPHPKEIGRDWQSTKPIISSHK